MIKKKFPILLIVSLLVIHTKILPQMNFYEDSFNGGVTAGGYSPAYDEGGTGSFSLNIAFGSSIHKAYLFAGRNGSAAPLTVTLNGISYTFDNSNQATPTFFSSYGDGNSAVHAIDVTSDIDPFVSNYTLIIPSQPGTSYRFSDFYLYVAFEENSLQPVNTAIFLNTLDFATSLTYNNINLVNPILASSDAGVSLFTGYVCNTTTDGELIYINSTYIGLIGGPDINSGDCGGPVGSFYYQDCTLHGLSDDSEDMQVNGSDALSNANTIIPNNSTSFTMQFDHQSGNSPNNSIWAVILAYGNCNSCNIDAGQDVQICSGNSSTLNAVISDAVSYSWNTGETTSSITVSPAATTTYTVTGTNGSSCTDSDEVVVTVNDLPTAGAGSDQAICNGSTATLTATGGNTYEWNNGNTNAAITVNPVVTTTYTVTATSNNCTDEAQVTVNINPLPVVDAGNDTAVCTGSVATLTAGGAANYAWNTGKTTSVITVSPQVNSTYTVTGTDSNNCSDTDEIVITVNPIPAISLGTDTCIMPGASFNLIAESGFDNYLWQDGSSDNTFTVNDSGIYFVEITDTCGTVSDTVNISICPQLLIFVPNVFTPDGNGTNDCFKPAGSNIEEFEMYIFDRWGQLVFETTDINTGWDGICKNEICPEGVYTWVIFYKGSDDISNKKYGHVALLR